MSYTQRKAKQIFEEYQQAELSGDNNKAESLEKQLNDGGWKVTYGPDGLTIVKIEADGLLSQFGNQSPNYLPRNTPVSPYNGNSPTYGTGFYVLIGLGALALIITIILIIRAYKKNQYGGLTRLQKGA